jgi:transposase
VLGEQTEEFIAGVEHAALDPFGGYANALRDELPEAVAVLDAFHVIKRGTRSSTRSAAGCSRSSWAGGDTKTIRSRRSVDCCAAGASTCPTSTLTGEHTPHRGRSRLRGHGRVPRQLRSIYRATSKTEGRRITEKVIASFPTCPILEVARLGRTLHAWKASILARFDTERINNGART